MILRRWTQKSLQCFQCGGGDGGGRRQETDPQKEKWDFQVWMEAWTSCTQYTRQPWSVPSTTPAKGWGRSHLDSTPVVTPAYNLTHGNHRKTKGAPNPCTPVMFQDCFPWGLWVPRTSGGVKSVKMTALPSLVFLPVSLHLSLTAKRHLNPVVS